MTVTTQSFRQVFPEFGDSNAYPDARITFVLTEASLRLLPNVWGELLDTGVSYYAAHRLALASKLIGTGSNGQAVGAPLSIGVVSSKSVGPVSKSIDTGVGSVDGAGEYNSTPYGRTFFQLASSVAVGAMQF